MAKLKYNKTLMKLQRQPELPGWYFYMEVVAGLAIVIFIFASLAGGNTKHSTLNNFSNKPLPSQTLSPIVNSQIIKESNTSNMAKDSLVTVKTIAGNAVNVSYLAYQQARYVAIAKYTGDFALVNIASGESEPTVNKPSQKVAIKSVYIVNMQSNFITFLVYVIPNLSEKSIVAPITLHIDYSGSQWEYSPKNNLGN